MRGIGHALISIGNKSDIYTFILLGNKSDKPVDKLYIYMEYRYIYIYILLFY